jgi:hypothetical protein
MFAEYFMFEKHKRVQLFKLYFLQGSTLWKYTILSATGKLSETFLVAILWKPFQLFRSIFNDVISIQKRRLFNADFSWGTS